MLQAGDVVLFKSTKTWISRLVAKVTDSEYTHVGLMITDTTMIEANRFIKARIIPFTYNDSLHSMYRLPDLDVLDQHKINRRAMLYINYPYDYLRILGMLIRSVFRIKRTNLFDQANALICSELIDYSFYYSGIDRSDAHPLGDVTPHQLLEVYDLRKV